MVLYLLVIGIISIVSQIVILRELYVAFFGVELIYILAIGVWLLGTAIGAAIGRKRFRPNSTHVAILLLIFTLLLSLDLVFIRASRLLLAGTPGAFLPLSQQLIILTAGVVPLSASLGLLFQWAAKCYIRTGQTLAKAYAIESLGAVIGGILSTLAMAAQAANIQVWLSCIILGWLAIYTRPDEHRPRLIRLLVGSLMAIGILGMLFSANLDRSFTRWNHPHLVATGDTPYSRVTVSRLGEQLAVFENDALRFETQGTAAEEFVHLSLIHHPSPQRVLLLGGSLDGTLCELLKYPALTVDAVEINRAYLEFLHDLLPAPYRTSLANPRVNLIIADPRHYLSNLTTKYDAILVAMPEPDSGQSSRFYTVEFFRQSLTALNPDGILAFRLRSAENLWTRQLSRKISSIYLALDHVFGETLILPGPVNLLMASPTPFGTDPERLAQRWRERNLETRLVSPAYLRYLLTNDRRVEIDRILQDRAPLNSDRHLVCYQASMLIWLAKFYPPFAQVRFSPERIGHGRGLIGFILFLVLITWLLRAIRRFPNIRRLVIVALAGLLGMIFETVLLLHYQIQKGILYQHIGLLMMMFMVGLAMGSYTIHQMAGRTNFRRNGRFLIMGFGLLTFMGLINLNYDFYNSLIIISIVLFLTGFLMAGLFAFASLEGVKSQHDVVSPLYAADLLGGSAGALLATLILIPFAGLNLTVLVAGTLALGLILAI